MADQVRELLLATRFLTGIRVSSKKKVTHVHSF